ncbi:MAG: CoA transferase [Chloroflexi bacterium]|nr:CoA transferase [Chloroflexota bacterium]
MQYPLRDYRVLDFGWVIAGPLLGQVLADMGAEVIKVETRKHLDEMRQSPLNTSRDPEKDPVFHTTNRNKLGVTVDMSHPEGRLLLKEMVKTCDVVAENFSPRVMKEHGLNYESLRRIKPDLIMVSLPAAGSYGPLSHIVTYGPTVSSLAGLDSMVGYYGERVLGSQGFYADMTSAIHAAFAVLSALYYRNNTGLGQHIEVPQWEAAACCIGEAIMEYTINGRIIGPRGNRHPTMAPHGNYPCKGEDKWVSIAVKTEEEWSAFCNAVGNPPWTSEERFADAASRLSNVAELDEYVAQWTRNHTHYEAAEILQRAGVAAAPVLDVGERYLDPHFQERQIYADFEHPAIGKDIIAGLSWKLSATPGGIRSPAPLLGQHNDYVFGEILGLPQKEIQRLMEEKVIY